MATREEWVQAFEAINGRKPTPGEFMEAKEAEFPLPFREEPRDEGSQNEQQAEQLASESIANESGQDMSTDLGGVSEQSVDSSPKKVTQSDSKEPGPQIPFENPYLKGKQHKDNLFVNIILPIIVLLLGLLFVLLAWILPISILFTLLAFVTFVVAIVAMALSLRSSKKALSIIAVVVTGIFFVSSIGGTIYQGARWIMDHADSFNVNDVRKAIDYIDESYQFEWTEQQFRELKVNQTSLEEILAKHDLASDAEWNGGELTLRYEDEEDSSVNVTLYFEAEEGAKYVLSGAHAFLGTEKVKIAHAYKSDWKQSELDDLTLGTSENLLKGTRLSEVLKKHSEASGASNDLTWTSDGDLVEEVRVSYYDYSAKGDHLSSVYLTFKYDRRENDYFLTYKS